ncbi:acyltransferase [Leclercia sp.]|uniref:acyltransferase n=1 Tax=Leclercia sp. TaxID=1898428 RepID=UPI00289C9899|nr:acyltransferase [Leclercia sp.]
MHNLDEKSYNQKKVDCQPWLRSTEHNGQQHIIRDILRKNANAIVAENAYIATDANIFTSNFKLGSASWIASGAVIRGEITIGNDCSVNVNAHIAGKVSLGNGCRIASMASIYGFNHGYERTDKFIKDQSITIKGVTLGDDIWVGANAVILDGVEIGEHSIVAAGSVVTKSFPPYSIIAGNPAKRIKDRRKYPLVAYRLEDKNSGLKYEFDMGFDSFISCHDGMPMKGWVLHSDLKNILIKTALNTEILAINNKRPDVIKSIFQVENEEHSHILCGFEHSLELSDIYSVYAKTSKYLIHIADIVQTEIITND